MKYQALRPYFFLVAGWGWWDRGGGVGWSMAVYSDRWWLGVVLSGLTWGGD